MKKIDLSKIAHRELPTKKIKLEIGQEIQEVDIVPINRQRFNFFRLNIRR